METQPRGDTFGVLGSPAEKPLENKQLTDEQKQEMQAHLGEVLRLRMYYEKQPDKELGEKILGARAMLRAGADGDFERTISSIPAIELETLTNSSSYKDFTEYAKKMNMAEVLGALSIEREAASQPQFLSDDDLREHIEKNIPPLVVDSLSRISFQEPPYAAREDGTFGFFRIVGFDRKPEIVIYDENADGRYISALAKARSVNSANPEQEAKEVVLSRISHELGHALHSALPVAALRRWKRQTRYDETAITEYVGEYFDPRHELYDHRYAEDFAESFSMLIHNPEQLNSLSSVRFEGMRQIFKNIMPGYEESEES